MYAWFVARLVRNGFERLSRDTVALLLERYADDAHFRFPGEHALAVDCHSKAEITQWFARLFERVPDLRFEVEEVIVKGPPWDTYICTRYTGRGSSPNAVPLCYRGMQFARMSWGKLTAELVYPDTQAIAGFLATSESSRR